MRAIIAVVVAVVLLAGCASTAGTPSLDGSAWQLTRWSEAGIDPRAFRITANFAEGRIAGKSGINNYTGPITTGPGDRFTVGPTAGTRMAGPPEAMEAEQTYFRLLDQVRTYRRTGAELILGDAAGLALLTYAAAD